MAEKKFYKEELKILKEDFDDLKVYLDEIRNILPISVCTLSSFWVIVDINRTAGTLIGYKPLEIIGQSIDFIFQKKQELEKIKEKAERGKRVITEETLLTPKNKKEILVSISIVGRKDREGNLIGYFLSIADITETKKYQKKLEERTKELEKARATLEIKVKTRTRELKELAESLEEKVKERTKESEKRTKELEESRTALMNMLEDVEESRKALINMLEDVEEARGKAEEEKNKTLAVITNFADGLLALDKENKLSLINPQAEVFFDVKSRDIIDRPILELSTFPTIEPVVKLVGKEIKGVFRKEVRIREDLVLEVSTIPVTREEEKLGTLIILHDVTREKTIERMKTEFVSLTAHQLRTPLSAIKWTLRMLLDGDLGRITEEQKDFLEKTYKSNERMITLINDLLDVTRIEEGRYLYKPVLTDTEPIVQFAINSHKEEIKKKKIKFEFKKPEEELPKIKLDVEKIRLAIDNLIDNAIRYTPAYGKVTVSLEYRKGVIEFSIKDTGVGIPKDQQGRVFTKFFRAANVMRMATEGFGLGLFITKNIIEAHGGKIWFESEEGKGTTFYFTLSVKEEFGEFLKEF